MRVRTGRFEKLKSGESRDSKAVEVPDGQHPVQAHAAVAPPASRVAGDPRSQVHADPQRPQLAEHRRPAPPLDELHGAQPVTQPLIQLAHDLRNLCQPEVRLPSWHLAPQVFGDLLETAPPRAPRQLPDALT